MSAYTIFFCGTGSNSNDYQNDNFHAGELISTLATHMQSPQYNNWIIVDGPGSGNLMANEKWAKPPLFRRFAPKFMVDGWDFVAGTAFGSGWDNNVAHAIAVLKKDSTDIDLVNGNIKVIENYNQRLRGPEIPSQVNLVGWSRGGITCHMMANAMLNDPELKNIPVNIFAIDPVTGPGNLQKVRTELGKNVHNYYAVYATNELSSGFTPTIPSTGKGGCRNELIPMPGRHATVVGNASATGGNAVPGRRADYPQPGTMVRHLVEKQLTEWGTQLSNRLNLTDDEMLKLYDDMLLHHPEFRKMSETVYICKQGEKRAAFVGGTKKRDGKSDLLENHKLLRPLNAVGIDRAVFINHLHMTLVTNQRIFLRNNQEDRNTFPATYESVRPFLNVG